MRTTGRVDLGGRLPRPRTDPGVHVKCTQLVTLWRCPSHGPLACGDTVAGSMSSAWFRPLVHNSAPPSLHGVRRKHDSLYRLAHAKVDAFQINAEELAEEVERDLQARRERLATHLPDAVGTS
jgi:hypothetical protein